jgi:hypothetical protein
MSDTIRNIGFEADITSIQAHKPQLLADATPILSAAIDRRTYPRTRCLVVFNMTENGATAHTVAVTVTESATSGGSYTACTTAGTATALSADGIQWISVKPNAAMPFIKVTLTGSHTDVDAIVAASVVFLPDNL